MKRLAIVESPSLPLRQSVSSYDNQCLTASLEIGRLSA